MRQDSPADGVTIFQPVRGYHYSLDPIALVGFALESGQPLSAVDAGAGSGVAAYLLANRGVARVDAVEVRPEWEPFHRASQRANSLPVHFHTADMRDLVLPVADLCVCNPPYFRPESGPVASDPIRAHARHALSGDLAELIPALARLGRRVVLVLPVGRSAEAEAILGDVGRGVRRRLVLGDRLVLLEGGGDAPRENESAPLYDAKTGFSERLQQLYKSAGARLAESGSANSLSR